MIANITGIICGGAAVLLSEDFAGRVDCTDVGHACHERQVCDRG